MKENVKFNSDGFKEYRAEFEKFKEQNPEFSLSPTAAKIAKGWDDLKEAFKTLNKEGKGVTCTVVSTGFSPIKARDGKRTGWAPCSFKMGGSIYAVNLPTMFNGCQDEQCPDTSLEFGYWWKQSKGEDFLLTKCEDGTKVDLDTPISMRVKDKDGKRTWQDVSTMTPKIIEWR